MFQKYIIDMNLTNIKYVVQYIKQKVLQLCHTDKIAALKLSKQSIDYLRCPSLSSR